MRNFEELSDFVRNNKDWRDKLLSPPYNLRSVTECPYHKDWWMVMYSLFETDMSLAISRQCRGTIVDGDGNIICAPYLKFFNYGEKYADEIDWSSTIIRDKIDGQLIKMFRYDGKSYWVTNGGWDLVKLDLEKSCPFKDGKMLLDYVRRNGNDNIMFDSLGEMEWEKNIPNGTTLMFEMVSPWTKIICTYDTPKLWFHGCRMSDGIEITAERAKEMFDIPYDIPSIIKCDDIASVINVLDTWNGESQEGVVICDKNFKRIKIKCNDYIKCKFESCLHSEKMKWRVWSEGEWDDMRGDAREIIDEFDTSMREIAEKFHKIWYDSLEIRTNLMSENGISSDTLDEQAEIYLKKLFASKVLGIKDSIYRSKLFASYNTEYDRFYSYILWEMQMSWKRLKMYRDYVID